MRNRANEDIRQAAKESGVFLYVVADKLGIADNTFLRRLRKELPDTEKQQIFSIISELSAKAGV